MKLSAAPALAHTLAASLRLGACPLGMGGFSMLESMDRSTGSISVPVRDGHGLRSTHSQTVSYFHFEGCVLLHFNRAVLIPAGLTEEEKTEGERAKAALAEEGGGDGEDGDEGNYKNKSQFFTHLKKSEARCRCCCRRAPSPTYCCAGKRPGAAQTGLHVLLGILRCLRSACPQSHAVSGAACMV